MFYANFRVGEPLPDVGPSGWAGIFSSTSVLQANNIHIAVCPPGGSAPDLSRPEDQSGPARAKARIVLATDGITLGTQDLSSDDAPIACGYPDFPNHFGSFLPLAGINTVR